MQTLATIHGALGESLVLVYLFIAAGTYLRRRHGGL